MSDQYPRVMVVSRAFIMHRGKLLALQRAATAHNEPYRWEVPGGKLEKDCGFIDTLEREVREETGLTTHAIDTLVHCESDILVGGYHDGVHRITLFAISQMIGGTFRLSEEHDEYRWCSYVQFMRLDLTLPTRNAAMGLETRLKKAGIR